MLQEAKASFANDGCYMESLLSTRHIQIIGDKTGKAAIILGLFNC